MSKSKATFADLGKIKALSNTLVKFDVKLKVVDNDRREELFNWLQKWTPHNDRHKSKIHRSEVSD